MEQNPSPTQSKIDQKSVAQITRLVRKGLLPAKDLPALKLAMIRRAKVNDIARLPRNQRDILQKYNNALSSAALGSTTSLMAVARNIGEEYEITKQEYISEELNTDPPMIVVLKRKGVRIFPDGKRVALYTNEKLNLTFTVPYATNKGAENPLIGVSEETDIMENLDQVAAYAQQDNVTSHAKHFKFADGSKLKVSHGAAKAIHMVHGALNDENKKKFADMLTTPKGFEKAAHFALSKVKFSIGDK